MEERFNDISEFFSYLLDVPATAWRFHLATDSYSEHMALNDFYENVQDDIDSLVECYFGKYGKLGFLAPLENPFANVGDSVSFLEGVLDDVASANQQFVEFDDSELQSALDDIISEIDSTLYKLKNLR
jgi:hypothetical protein